jgi:hypothetical protein
MPGCGHETEPGRQLVGKPYFGETGMRGRLTNRVEQAQPCAL